MPIFEKSLPRIDESNPQDALKKFANHLKYIQEQLEYTLLNLDSRNITEIDTDKTVISDSSGTTSIGSYINLAGRNGEAFKVGKNAKGKFEFVVNGADGSQTMYIDSSGNLVITRHTNLTIDGGEW